MNITCVCYDIAQHITVLTECLSFSLMRERYLPYAVLHLNMRCGSMEPPVNIRFFFGSTIMLDGIVQKAEKANENGQSVLRISAHSYAAALGRNQLKPGIHSNVTLESLMTEYALPHISYQSGAGAVSYIYVKEHSPMWEALSAYNYKLNGGFPYVRMNNVVCAAPQPEQAPIILPDTLLAKGTRGNSSAIVSRIEMASLSGEYGVFSADNPEAPPRQIVNVRQIPFDRQFLYDPAEGLRYRIALSNRRAVSRYVTYPGYCGEDIEDAVTADGITQRVSKLTVRGDSKGIVTTDEFYTDSFCNLGGGAGAEPAQAFSRS